MSSPVRRLSAAALLVALLAGSPAGAATAAEPVVADLVAREQGLDITLAPIDLPPATLPADATVEVLIDGVVAETEVTSGAGEPRVQELRTLILVLDTSGSMQGTGLRSAQQAATRLIGELPADVRVGLVRFSDDVQLLVSPTADRKGLLDAVAGLQAAGDTRLYDAVPVALTAAGSVGGRRVVLLSDGRDDGSRSDQAAAVAAIAGSGVTVDVVDASADGSAAAGMQPLADAGGGRAASTTGGAGLTDVFSEVAEGYLARLTLATAVPRELAGKEVEVTVVVQSADGPLVESRTIALAEAEAAPAAAPVEATDALPRPAGFWTMLVAVFLGTSLLLVLAITSGDTRAVDRRKTWRSLSAYTFDEHVAAPPVPVDGSRLGASQLGQTALHLADRAVERRGSGERLSLALDRAGVSWRPNEWLVLRGICCLAGALLVPFAVGVNVLAVALGAAVGWWLPRAWLRFRSSRRSKAFTEAMPDALQMLSAGLATGYSLAQALDTVVQEGPQPLAGELGRALAEARIGLPLEDALDTVAVRMQSEDFRWVVMAIRVQREVGGNLAEVLTRVGTTMRDRASLRRQVKALSAEGRISIYVLVALPLLMGAFMLTFRRDYFRPMYTETVGIIALIVMAFMLVIGTAWMNKLVKVEI